HDLYWPETPLASARFAGAFDNVGGEIENRQPVGRDAALPSDGLAIWHVDLNGSNSDQQMTPWEHYFCTLVQADGLWELEQGIGSGNAGDLWAAPLHVEFNPLTSPPATWWSGSAAPIYIDAIGESGPTMTFNYRPELGTMLANVTVTPAGLPAPWRLEGPGGYLLEGTGERELLLWETGFYSLTWLELRGWTLPDPAVVGDTLLAGEPLVFSGAYTAPPFTAVELAAPAGGRGVSLVDFDGDGDLDIYICRDDGPNQLLRNDGGLSFTDVATGPLADPGPTWAAAWADHDNDGDPDVYLVRDGQPNQMLLNSDGVFTDVAALGLEVTGPGRAAAWYDFNRDGKLDLYLVQQEAPNTLFRNLGDLGLGSWSLLPHASSVLDDDGPGQAAPWCDWEGTGLGAPALVNDAALIMTRNYDGALFEAAGELGQGALGRAAAWGDYDADGDFDLFLAGAGSNDRLYRQTAGLFESVLTLPGDGDGTAVAAVFADLDNDGHLDLYVAQAGQDRLLFGDGAGGFVASPAGPVAASALARAVACGDLDGDGALDLVLTSADAPPTILRNTIAGRGHWLHLDLTGTISAADAIGTGVRLVTGDRSQLRQVQAGGGSASQDARLVAFGLGEFAVADSLIVCWLDGSTTLRLGVAADQVLQVVQGTTTAVTEPGTGGDAGAQVLPRVTSLHGAAPNPFNPRTVLGFDLARPGAVEIAVYSLDGRRVAVLVAGPLAAGRHEAVWDGRDSAGRRAASGGYLIRMRTAEGVWGKRVVMVK
ncbi:MAG: FG-GAP-like repeat-containing protein, partial [Candidatus Krumholzibacteriia bacterium]